MNGFTKSTKGGVGRVSLTSSYFLSLTYIGYYSFHIVLIAVRYIIKRNNQQPKIQWHQKWSIRIYLSAVLGLFCIILDFKHDLYRLLTVFTHWFWWLNSANTHIIQWMKESERKNQQQQLNCEYLSFLLLSLSLLVIILSLRPTDNADYSLEQPNRSFLFLTFLISVRSQTFHR